MPIYYRDDSLFESDAQVLVNAVNTVGVMGKGIAKEFKRRYPEMFKQYKDYCDSHILDIGKLWIYKAPDRWILSFPTKRHWGGRSRIEYIEAGLKKFVANYKARGIKSISFPMLGCENGGLDWESQVKPLMKKYLSSLPINTYIHLYRPSYKKPNAQKMIDFLGELKQRLEYSKLADYLFHVTDIRNAAKILQTGSLFSYDEVKHRKINFVNSKSWKELNSRADNDLSDFVRFYFRPLNATTILKEGFKTREKLADNGHCPVPVYFLFDIREIVTLRGTIFSDGNLSSRDADRFRTAEEFIKLPFKQIYGNNNYSEDDENKLYKKRRMAEVAYPTEVSLEHLKYIYCRSIADYETLQSLISPQLWKKWKNKIRLRPLVFLNRWLYIKEVEIQNDGDIVLKFNLPQEESDRGPFQIDVKITDDISGKSQIKEFDYSHINECTSELRIVGIRLFSTSYEFHCLINGELAYLGTTDKIGMVWTNDEILF